MNRFAAVCLAVVLVVSAFPPVVSATSHSGAEEIVVTYRVENVRDGTATLTATASIPSSVSELTFRGDYRVTDTEGFRETANGLEWDGYTADPSVRYRANLSKHCPANSRVACVTDGDTALVDIEAVDYEFRYRYSGSDPGWSERYHAADDNIEVLGAFSVAGEYEVVEREVDGISIQFRYPTESKLGDRQTGTVTSAADQLDVDGPQTAAVIGAPEGIRSGGLARDQTAWVNQHEAVQSPYNTWVHEYVHTRQPISQYGDEMDWYYESSASYQSALLSLRQGEITHDVFYGYVTTEAGSDRVLASESTRTQSHHYTKGRRVMAALDVKIREASGGDADSETVLRLMNEHEGKITYEDFKDMVERAAGENMDDWIDRHVKGDAVPDVPKDPSLYADTTTDRDSDADGLTDREEYNRGTNPFASDTDDDGLTDGQEAEIGTNPTDADTDDDGLSDGREVKLGTDPAIADTDGDGLSDRFEVSAGLDPTTVDSDDDGVADLADPFTTGPAVGGNF